MSDTIIAALITAIASFADKLLSGKKNKPNNITLRQHAGKKSKQIQIGEVKNVKRG